MPDFAGRILHVREFYDADADERIGWAFAIQGPDYLAVEELYVRPQFRRRGYGARLLVTLKELSHQTGLSLWFYIPFADSKRENLGVAERLLAKESYYLFPSGVRWCPLVGAPPRFCDGNFSEPASTASVMLSSVQADPKWAPPPCD